MRPVKGVPKQTPGMLKPSACGLAFGEGCAGSAFFGALASTVKGHNSSVNCWRHGPKGSRCTLGVVPLGLRALGSPSLSTLLRGTTQFGNQDLPCPKVPRIRRQPQKKRMLAVQVELCRAPLHLQPSTQSKGSKDARIWSNIVGISEFVFWRILMSIYLELHTIYIYHTPYSICSIYHTLYIVFIHEYIYIYITYSKSYGVHWILLVFWSLLGPIRPSTNFEVVNASS